MDGNPLGTVCSCTRFVRQVAVQAGLTLRCDVPHMLITPCCPTSPCPLPAGGQCPTGTYTDPAANNCVYCPESGGVAQYLQLAAIAVLVVVAAVVGWSFLGRRSRKLKQFKDIDVHIQFGLCEAGRQIATALEQSFVLHLGCAADRVYTETAPDPPHLVHAATQTPAAVFVLTEDWVAQPDCVGSVVKSLSARFGVDLGKSTADDWKVLTKLPHGKLAAMRAGTFLVACGPGVQDSAAYKMLTDTNGLGLDARLIADDLVAATDLGSSASMFLTKERLGREYTQMRKDIVMAAEGASGTIRTLLANKEKFAQAASRTTTLLQIQLPHIQMTAYAWSLNLSWPDYVHRLRDSIGAVFSFNLGVAIKPECLSGESAEAKSAGSVLTSLGVMAFVFVTLLVMGIKYRCCRSKDAKKEEARRAHITHFLVGLYSWSFPLLITQSAKWLVWRHLEGHGSNSMWASTKVAHVKRSFLWEMVLAVSVAVVWLLLLAVVVPVKLVRVLRAKKAAGLLSDENPSLPTLAAYGWLYDKYREGCYYFEVIALEGRAVLIVTGALLTADHPITGQVIGTAVILVSLALQLKLKPFKESPKAAAHWSSANKMAALALLCQAAAMVAGMASAALKSRDANTDATDALIAIVVLVSFLLPLTLTAVGQLKQIRKLKGKMEELDEEEAALELNPVRRGREKGDTGALLLEQPEHQSAAPMFCGNCGSNGPFPGTFCAECGEQV